MAIQKAQVSWICPTRSQVQVTILLQVTLTRQSLHMYSLTHKFVNHDSLTNCSALSYSILRVQVSENIQVVVELNSSVKQNMNCLPQLECNLLRPNSEFSVKCLELKLTPKTQSNTSKTFQNSNCLPQCHFLFMQTSSYLNHKTDIYSRADSAEEQLNVNNLVVIASLEYQVHRSNHLLDP